MADLTEKQQEELYETLQHKKRAFLAAYSECGNITKAAEAADVSRQAHYNWLSEDQEYTEAFKHAEEEAGERLELEARRRAADGFEEPVFYQGEIVGTVRKYSDSLLMFLLKGAKPEKYKERVQSDTNVKGDMNHNVHVKPDLSMLNDEELDKLEHLLRKSAPNTG